MDIERAPDEPQPVEGTTGAFRHTPVLVERIVELLSPVPDGTYVDATLGGGGHAAAVLGAHAGLRLLGLDQDPDAIAAAAARLAPLGDRTTLRHARFDALAEAVAAHGGPVTAVLFDLGVSSPQLDRGERGFSHRFDAPLDMRMDTTSTGRTADEVVNRYPEAALARVLSDLGDERFASRIARAVVAARPVTSTLELAALVRDAIPAPARRRGGHPARRSFQAIRIEVNAELEVLPVALAQAIDVLAPGGRCAVLAYHSGEDRIVKSTFREASTGGCTCPPGLPCGCGAVPVVRLLRPGAWKPSAEEVAANPRAASARLRAVEKLPAHDRTIDPQRGAP